MASAQSGALKAVARVNAQVEAGNFYEAQQMYKTVYHRYRSRKQLPESYQILQEGAAVQLRHGQLTCGIELGNLLVEAYTTDKVQPGQEVLQGLYGILQALPAPSASEAEDSSGEDSVRLSECSRFVMAAIKWAHKATADDAVRRMHDLYASYVWSSYGWRQFGKASLHFTRGSDASAFASALQECSTSGQSGEEELFVARAVLQTLACASKANAAAQAAYAQRVLEVCSAGAFSRVADRPYMHFLQMLLQAIQKRSHPLYQLLRVKYEPSLERDKSFAAFLTRIEQTYFGIAPPGGGGGLLGGLLKSLMEGGEDE